ncbi:MAG: hypothetical protein LBT01_00165 [Spirochaetaceae bacterium]|nr:hypothetical protein [Spirochaetaceae bacterium]
MFVSRTALSGIRDYPLIPKQHIYSHHHHELSGIRDYPLIPKGCSVRQFCFFNPVFPSVTNFSLKLNTVNSAKNSAAIAQFFKCRLQFLGVGAVIRPFSLSFPHHSFQHRVKSGFYGRTESLWLNDRRLKVQNNFRSSARYLFWQPHIKIHSPVSGNFNSLLYRHEDNNSKSTDKLQDIIGELK